MNRSIRNGMTVAAALALLVSAEEVTSANTVNNTLNEGGIKTAYNAQVAVGVASDHLLAVWTAKDAAGHSQIVGQPFSTMNGGTYGHTNPVLLSISNTTTTKSWPAAAWSTSDGFNRMLVVWEDDVSGTNSDIWGAILDDKGDFVVGTGLPNPFPINNDSDVEKMPTVTWVSTAQSFVVTYTRKIVSTGRVALTTQWVDAFQDIDTNLVDAVPSGVSQTATRPTTAFAGGMILFTWNDNQYGWAPIEETIIPTVFSISGAAGIAAAGNDVSASYALAWHTGDTSTAKIWARVFPTACDAPSCANADVTVLAAGNGVTNIHYPAISAAGLGYGVFSGTEGTVWKINYTEVAPASGVNTSITPTCAGALLSSGGHSLGSSGGVFAAATAPNPLHDLTQRQFMIYDSFCGSPSSYAKEMVAGPNPSSPVSDVLNFNVSTNGN